MNKPFVRAALAALYIVCLVLIVMGTPYFAGHHDTILAPITMLSVFVLSAALMGFLFLSEPLLLYFDGKRKEALAFFGHTVAFFACFAALFAAAALVASFF